LTWAKPLVPILGLVQHATVPATAWSERLRNEWQQKDCVEVLTFVSRELEAQRQREAEALEV